MNARNNPTTTIMLSIKYNVRWMSGEKYILKKLAWNQFELLLNVFFSFSQHALNHLFIYFFGLIFIITVTGAPIYFYLILVGLK